MNFSFVAVISACNHGLLLSQRPRYAGCARNRPETISAGTSVCRHALAWKRFDVAMASHANLTACTRKWRKHLWTNETRASMRTTTLWHCARTHLPLQHHPATNDAYFWCYSWAGQFIFIFITWLLGPWYIAGRPINIQYVTVFWNPLIAPRPLRRLVYRVFCYCVNFDFTIGILLGLFKSVAYYFKPCGFMVGQWQTVYNSVMPFMWFVCFGLRAQYALFGRFLSVMHTL